MEMTRGKGTALLSMVLLGFWACATAVLTRNGVNIEVQALMDIKKSLIDPHGVLTFDENAVDPCGWTIVGCSHESLVISLSIPSQNLSGTISRSIGSLTNLTKVLLQDNNISGPIPFELGRLPKLQELDLSDNLLTGEIPSSLSQLKKLQYLRLNNNNLSGAIPLALGNLTQLTFLDLSFNNLSGPVPKLLAKTFNVLGNPIICATGKEPDCNGTTPISLSFSTNNTQNPEPSGRPNSHKLALAFGTSLGCICLLILGFGFLFWWRHKHNKQIFFDVNEQHREELCLGNLRRFQFRELQIATHNFCNKNILGKGGFGNVYKGYLHDGTVVAVKRLKDANNVGGEIQFQTEVEMISLAVHRNLLRLYGFCITSTERLLVYPFMSNGSVASRLKGKDESILHEQCDPKIIHRDVKAANILLDDYCEAVVGDFGLAKLLDHRDSHVTTAVRGTVGHIAPEYLSTGQSSEKTDVFGFGILLLELITGQRALPSHRPKMSEVVRMLEGDGLAEKWEASQKAEATRCTANDFSSSERYSDLTDDSSLLVQAMELSGPR